jgi:hypothetical protein
LSGLRDAALKAVVEELRTLKFRGAVRDGRFMFQVAPGVFGGVGLNTMTQGLPVVFEINPVIAVRHDRIESVVDELQPELNDKKRFTIARPLGYLMPQNTFLTWEFRPDGDHVSVAADLGRKVVEYGLPFMRQFADWDEVSRVIRTTTIIPENQVMIYRPIVYAIDGDMKIAREMVDQELRRVGDKSDFYSIAYREFATRFYEMFAIGAS